MADENILKGVFKEGAMVASVIQKGDLARIMLKGAEPGSAAFRGDLGKAAAGCKSHVEKFAERELCAVCEANPAGAETEALGPEELQSMGITKLTFMDRACGIAVRVIEAEPPPVPLPYGSLRSSSGLPDQPGQVEIPASFPRKSYKDLTDPEKKVYEAAAQVAGRGLVRLVCFEDGDLRLAISVKDAPPPRARSVLVPLGLFAKDLAGGASLDEIGRRLGQLRT
jgi:hypothetical protein